LTSDHSAVRTLLPACA